jgi:ribosomal protein S18 acetylase RimI-like enzyme
MPTPDPQPTPVRVVEADLDDATHQQAIVALTDAYARDPMGDGAPLPPDVREALIAGLRQHPTTMVFLAFAREEPVGLANCFRGFSTFTARPLVNIHDLVVPTEYRGRGIGRLLLDAVERKARALDCCRLTLEVTEGNAVARHLYERVGFARSMYGEGGGLLVYAKEL